MTAERAPFLEQLWDGLEGDPAALDAVDITGEGTLPSVFAVTELATASVASAGLAAAEFVGVHRSATPSVQVDRRLASWWFRWGMEPIGWELPSVWDSVAGLYECTDGWIRLHTNAPHHRAAALDVLDVDDGEPSVDAATMKARTGAAVGAWKKTDLETAVVANGGAAAAMYAGREWAASEPGSAVTAEPIVSWETGPSSRARRSAPSADRPLLGIRVLDLTRVLAGPVATRFLAGLGADVLRIDPPGWDEPSVLSDVTLGKRCARLDLRTGAGRTRLTELMAEADVLVHGYRDGALAGLGFDAGHRRAIRPDLVDVSLNAYGWSGPWRGRRGFDSLVQMSSGIAHAGMEQLGKDGPFPLPVQALDHSAGYLLAAAALRGLAARDRTGAGTTARASLARMSALLSSGPAGKPDAEIEPTTAEDFQPDVEHTVWGDARRLLPPVRLDGCTLAWDLPAGELGTSEPIWLPRA